MGNHEYAAFEMLSRLFLELRDGDLSALSKNDAETLVWEVEEWCKIGGLPTLEEFRALPQDERVVFLDYIADFSLYETVNTGGKRYILTHSGLPDKATHKNLHLFDAYDFSMAAADYTKPVGNDIILVTGHRATYTIDEKSRGRIFRAPGHIAIDIGMAYDDTLDVLGCICLTTGEEFYV
jgi:hypothetical protein